jgi:hypothetical protein
MARLTEIQEQLLDTGAAWAQLDRALAADPRSSSLKSMAQSLRKRQEALEAAFLQEADQLGVDICSYRLFTEGERPTIAGLSKVLGDFQGLVSVVYDAVKTAMPKARARVGADSLAATTFEFGYAFPGSLGVVLTVPNERLLIGESKLDETIETVFRMARAEDSSQILEHAKQLGPAPVRAMYKWALGHVESGLGVDIEWRRERLVRAKLLAQRPELQRLYMTIESTSEETTEQFEVKCDLVGADVTRRSFHIRLETGEDIRGAIKAPVSPSQTVELPKRYRVTLLKSTKTKYSTDEEETRYELLRLEPA